MSSPTLDSFRDQFSDHPPPVIVFNKSHSGSRLLAELLDSAGVFLGSHLNGSRDSLDILELVEYLVTRYYPDYSPLWDPQGSPDHELIRLLKRVFDRHLQDISSHPEQRWGWKLCETAYVLPVLDYCFPRAQYIHLIRDGRDVAFCDHKAPDSIFWRKIYFNTERIRTFSGLRLTPQAYRRQSHVFNAIHWVNSVSVGRDYGAMLRERYFEVRYEDLCRDFYLTAKRILNGIGIEDAEEALRTVQPAVYDSSLGKYKTYPKRWLDRVVRIEKPLLLSLGYLERDSERPKEFLWRSHWADRLVDRWKWRSINGRL
jgi:Sulfotransferase family